jgi:hypothetical protein
MSEKNSVVPLVVLSHACGFNGGLKKCLAAAVIPYPGHMPKKVLNLAASCLCLLPQELQLREVGKKSLIYNPVSGYAQPKESPRGVLSTLNHNTLLLSPCGHYS